MPDAVPVAVLRKAFPEPDKAMELLLQFFEAREASIAKANAPATDASSPRF